MTSLNKVLLIGNVGKDPEVIGGAVKFTIATSYNKKDEMGNKLPQVEWHNIVCFGKLLDIVTKYVKKGSKVYVEGSIKSNNWINEKGEKKLSFGIVAFEVKILDKFKPDDNFGNKAQEEYVDDSDIPF